MKPKRYSSKQLVALIFFAALAFDWVSDSQSTYIGGVYAMASSATPSSSCAVVGVGVLGTSLCQQLYQSPDFADVPIVGITKTDKRHKEIQEQVLGGESSSRLSLLTSEEALSAKKKYTNVVFCAPPSGFDDYAEAVKEAVDTLWEGKDGGGVFVFTSSGSVYGSGDGERVVTENSPTADITNNPRVARLVQAEAAVLEAGGCCLRLAGLYNLQRGAHNFWITSGKPIGTPKDGLINLLHYDDAAGACLAALRSGPKVCTGKTFLISDSNPLSRYEICQSALQAKAYQDYNMPTFTEDGEQKMDLGKVYDGTRSNEALNWAPKTKSFDDFMKNNA